MKLIPNSLYKILLETRRWAEDIVPYNYDIFSENLCGLCAISSYKILLECRKLDLPVHLAVATGHVYVLYNNEIICDVTASQFGRKSIAILKYNDMLPCWWRGPKLCKSDEEILNACCLDDWKWQHPFELTKYV